MSTPLVDVFASESAAESVRPLPSAPPPKFSELLREPLLHFLVLGGLLFALDYAVTRKDEDPNRIVVSAEISRDAIQTFEAARGRKPTAEELSALQRVWLDNEVLYREGLALGVDRGDTAIRERVIFKALSVVDSGVKLPPADDATLRAWFEKHRDKYDEPARFDFEEAALTGTTTEAAVRAFVAELNGGTPGDAKAGLRVFKARPRPTLVQSYGDEFTRALESAKPGEWTAMNTREGWRAVRLNAAIPPKPAVFEALRGPILHDWKDTEASEQRSAAVRTLAKKYTVEYQDPSRAKAPVAKEDP